MSNKRKHPTAVTPEEMAAEYRRALELERKRETYRRLFTKQGRFEASMVSLDALDTPDKLREMGRSTSLGAVIADNETRSEMAARCRNKLDAACNKLCRAGRNRLVRVLRLIAKNGSNRMESIWELAKDSMKSQGEHTTITESNSALFGVSKRG